MSAGASPRRWLPFVIAGASGFLLSFAIVAFLLFPADDAPQEVRVPSVVGLPFPDAERRLKALGLTAALGQERPSGDVPKNGVVAQTPVAGETVNAGTEIVLDVSEGVDRTTIPGITGLSRDDAERALRSAGLALGDVSEQAGDSARGVVLSSTPAAGTTVPRGTRVALLVSAGQGELSLPDVIGRDLDSARGLLEQIGLVLAPLEYDSLSSLPSGTIIGQTPAAGAAVATGSTVTLRIAGRP
jgi:serine/threonine-protein kinase